MEESVGRAVVFSRWGKPSGILWLRKRLVVSKWSRVSGFLQSGRARVSTPTRCSELGGDSEVSSQSSVIASRL